MKVPARSDHACFPPPGYVTVYEFSLRAGLQFPPASELIDILTIYGNDWNLQEKREKLKELPVPLHIGAEDLLRILKLPNLDALHYEVRYLNRYIDEEYLFNVVLSTQAGRSYAQMLKKSIRVPEVVPQKSHSKLPGREEGLQASRKKKVDEVLTVVSKGPQVSPSKSYIQKDVLNHQCIGHWRAEELVTIEQQEKNQQILEAENKRLQSVLFEKEAQQLPSIVIEKFKKSYAFKIIIEDHI
ncbi:hypothetical protein IEQ34_009744 [Dendrobium chrysotoxum]|uniref:Uncharacterized protein n=1 Tax=Dendrobium chrysotoxum TaxID=161865 RepID=A0AAV7H370_DENCH|nr:hypothetical protein IEQ34_009744 [Dendrobium chrysotoxum]